MEHPYQQYENSLLWKIIEKALLEMQKNNDITINTAQEYTTGFICKVLDEKKLLNARSLQHKTER